MTSFSSVTLLLPIAFVVASLGSGCGTVTRGTTEQFLVQSEPSGANVRLSTGITGITPVSFTIPRKGDLAVSITKEGYESVEINAPSRTDGTGVASTLANGLLGPCSLIVYGTIDLATGANLAHTPNPMRVVLKPIAAAALAGSASTAGPVAVAARDLSAAPTFFAPFTP